MRKNIIKRTVAVLMAGILTVGTILPATVSNASGDYDNQVLTRGSVLQVGPVEKYMPSGTGAKVTMHDAIPNDNIVNTYVRNDRGVRVSEAAASFRGTASGETKYMPYQTGTGIKGHNYYLCLLLTNNSKDQHLTVSCHFVP